MTMQQNFFAIFICLSSFFLQSQETGEIDFIKEQKTKITRAWQRAIAKIEQSRRLAPQLYDKVAPIVTKIVTSAQFKEKIASSVEQQYKSITQDKIGFTQLEQNTTIADFAPNFVAQPYLAKLYDCMADCEYALVLLRKLNSYKEIEVINVDTDLEPRIEDAF